MDSVVKLNRKLGVGGRGVVYEGFDHAKGHFVAVKEMAYMEPSVVGEEEDTELAEILSELACMREAQHPCLVQYYGARRSAVGVQIIMEYVSGGSLDYVLTRCGPLRESVARSYTRDVLQALQYLHEVMHVCHRDVKPANILITPDGRCKLADFGVAKHVEEGGRATLQQQQQQQQQQVKGLASRGGAGVNTKHDTPRASSGVREGFLQTAVGTPWYMAPEVINGGVDDDDDDDVEELEEDNAALEKAYAEACADWEAHVRTADGDGSLDDWSNAGPAMTTSHSINATTFTASAENSPVPRPPPLYATSSTSYYNPLKHILRRGRLARGSVGYTTRADIWSVGVTVYEMLTGTRPFGADLHNPSAVMFRIANCATAPPRLPAGLAVTATLQNFLDLCFVYDKDLRATARELLGHPWLRGEAGERESSNSLIRETSATQTRLHTGKARPASSSLSMAVPAPQPQPSVRHSVFDGVALLDAMDLPAYPAVTPTASSSLRDGSSGPATASGHSEERREERAGVGSQRGRPSVQRLSSGGVASHAPHRPAGASVEMPLVSPAEQAEASSRYAAARQRIGHTRHSAPRPTPLPPSVNGGGGIQTKYGAFVDLLSHP